MTCPASARLTVLLALAAPGVAAAAGPLPVPPPMPARSIAPSNPPPAGVSISLTNSGATATLFLPAGWTPPADGQARLVVHFHTIAWFTIQEHVRRGSTLPLLNFALGEGSLTYARPFTNHTAFPAWLGVAAGALRQHGAPTGTRIASVEISSFSAGYGAVREILREPGNRAVIDRIILCDSLYGGLAGTNGTPGRRVVTPEHVEPWLEFCRAATRGEKTFVLTTSDIQTLRYASTGECGAALAGALGVPFEAVPAGSIPAARVSDYPLLRRADRGGFHVWNYGGTNAGAHLTHVRHVADLWNCLDARR